VEAAWKYVNRSGRRDVTSEGRRDLTIGKNCQKVGERTKNDWPGVKNQPITTRIEH